MNPVHQPGGRAKYRTYSPNSLTRAYSAEIVHKLSIRRALHASKNSTKNSSDSSVNKSCSKSCKNGQNVSVRIKRKREQEKKKIVKCSKSDSQNPETSGVGK